jgi:co-chaperonin GroES (HSP10)
LRKRLSVVLAAGPGVPTASGALHPIGLKEGDRVVSGQSAGTDPVTDGEDRVILKGSDLLSVLVGNVQVSARRSG